MRAALLGIFLIQVSVMYAQLYTTDTLHLSCTETTVKKLNEDSLSSTFFICIPRQVKLHKHAHHTENVVVLSGEAIMQLGNETLTVRKGHTVFIPRNTPHKVTVTSKEPLRVLSIQSPAFDGSDRIPLE
ncbi:MAG: cupin domain-containing protein [Bacteroidota bacterium]